jgi:hypothetical protein
MKCPSKACDLIVLGVFGLLLWPTPSNAQASEQPAEVGYVSLTTVQQAQKEGEADTFASNLLIRFARTDGPGRVFAMTDQSGTAVVPFEPGTYCATAYGLDGKPAAMSARSMEPTHRCFSIKAGTTIEFSVTLAPGMIYVRSIPRLGVSEATPRQKIDQRSVAATLLHESGYVPDPPKPQ